MMSRLSLVIGLSTVLLCSCDPYRGSVSVDLSGEVPVFDLIDHAGRAPDSFLVESCGGEEGEATVIDRLWSIDLEDLSDWPITYGDPELGGSPKPLEEGVLYEAIAWASSGEQSKASGAEWSVVFRLDTDEIEDCPTRSMSETR